MKDREKKIQEIIRLKRYERPPEGFFEDFFGEFQRRQRSELPHHSSIGLFFERLGAWFRELGSAKWFAGAGVAYALLMAGIFLWPMGKDKGSDPNRVPASHEGVSPSVVEPPVIPARENEGFPDGQDF